MKWFNINYISKYFQNSEGRLYILIGCVWGFSLLGIANAIFLRIPGLNIIGPYARNIIVVVFVLLSYKALLSHIRPNDILFYFIFLFFYLIQFIIHPENQQELLEYFFSIFIFTFPVYFIGCTIDINKLDKFFLVISICNILITGVHVFFFSESIEVESEKGYTMGVSYSFLPSVLYSLWYYLRNRGLFYLLTTLIGILLLFSFGTRGPVVCVIVFIIFYLLLSNGKKKWWMLLSVLLFSFVIYKYFELIIVFMDNLFSITGRSTRITNQIIYETVDNDSGRGTIIEVLRGLLNGGEKLSYGIFGSYKYVDGYAHRIYWDFWFSYGYLFGTIFMLILSFVFIRGLRKCNTIEERGFWILLLCISIVALMFSDCYIFNSPFYLFLGYCVSRIRNEQLKTIS